MPKGLTVFNGYVSFLFFLFLNQTTNMAVQRAPKIFKKWSLLLRSFLLCMEMKMIM